MSKAEVTYNAATGQHRLAVQKTFKDVKTWSYLNELTKEDIRDIHRATASPKDLTADELREIFNAILDVVNMTRDAASKDMPTAVSSAWIIWRDRQMALAKKINDLIKEMQDDESP